jgi:uncharacterized protein YegP (UPF0339 family)
MKHPKVIIYKHFKAAHGRLAQDESEDEWGWRLIAANGEEVCSGEGHSSPRDAERAFRTVCQVVLELLAETISDGMRGIPVEVIS